MRTFLSVLSALALIALAYWAYHQNYATQASIRDVRRLHAEIGTGHQRLAMLRAEWAYLNRPDRLMDLAELNFDRLELLPLMPDAFGRVDQVTYPMAPLGPITNPVAVAADTAEAAPRNTTGTTTGAPLDDEEQFP